MPIVAERPCIHRLVAIPFGEGAFDADLSLPAGAVGLVVLCHLDLAADRASPAALAPELASHRIGFLRVTAPIGDAGPGLFLAAIDWARASAETRALRLGIYTSEAAAAAACWAVAQRPFDVSALVVAGGELAVAPEVLAAVRSPTLLFAAGDTATIGRSARALSSIRAAAHLAIAPRVPGESAALLLHAEHAAAWFREHTARDPEG